VTDPTDVERFAHARAKVLERIAAACGRAGRAPRGVELVAVSKTVPLERVRAAVVAGQHVFGENRVQEGAAKAAHLADPGVAWRLIGPLQSNKARRAVERFAAIDSVDSLALAQRIDRLAAELRPSAALPILLEVNVDADPAKHGWTPERIRAELDELLALEHLRVDGLMTIGRPAERPDDARPTFRALRALSDGLRMRDDRLGADLSMGMSADFEVAVEEGATIVRVGEALFGPRPHQR
jgi:PLP dependent protein